MLVDLSRESARKLLDSAPSDGIEPHIMRPEQKELVQALRAALDQDTDLVRELVEAGTDAWSEIDEALNSFGEGRLEEEDLIVRLRAVQSKLLVHTKAHSSLGVKG